MVQQVKDPALPLQRLGSRLQHGFDPWLGKFCVWWVQPKIIIIIIFTISVVFSASL